MDPISIAQTALESVVTQAFLSVFRSLNLGSEAWFQKSRLSAITLPRYLDHIINDIGSFPLFGTSRTAGVESAFVHLALSDRLTYQQYANKETIESLLRTTHQQHVSSYHGRSIESVVESTTGGIAIVGAAGTGKSTLLRHLSVWTARGQRIRGRVRFPFFVSVNSLARRHSTITQECQRFLASLGVAVPERVFRKLMSSGRVAVFVDGLDETSEPGTRAILDEIVDLRQRFRARPKHRAIFVVTARPYSLHAPPPDFTTWEVLPLSFEDRLRFISNWYEDVSGSQRDTLLRKCRGNPKLLDIGSTPLLLALLCALYFNDLDIPEEPEALYKRCVEGLLGGWDSFRDISRQSAIGHVPMARRSQLLSWLAAAMFSRGHVAFSAADLENSGVISEAAASLRTSLPDAEDLLPSLFSDFGLIIERARGLYSFSHLALQEYLTASWHVESRNEQSLITHRSDREWIEVTKFAARLLPREASESFMRKLTLKTDLGSEIEVAHLSGAWLSSPVCRPEVVRECMESLMRRFDRALSDASVFSRFTTENMLVLYPRPKGAPHALHVISTSIEWLWLVLRVYEDVIDRADLKQKCGRIKLLLRPDGGFPERCSTVKTSSVAEWWDLVSTAEGPAKRLH